MGDDRKYGLFLRSRERDDARHRAWERSVNPLSFLIPVEFSHRRKNDDANIGFSGRLEGASVRRSAGPFLFEAARSTMWQVLVLVWQVCIGSRFFKSWKR